ncbi:MAG: hypothetical protein IPJ39_08030 [Saprospiraceae bacterium]|nr:hypothetical protein [Saprospiraceae bacterium]
MSSRERPILSDGLTKASEHRSSEDLNDILKNILTKGGIVTDDQKILQKLKSKNFMWRKVSWMLALR